MAVTIQSERPGIYTDYQISGVLSAGRSAVKTVAVAAKAKTGQMGTAYTVTSHAAAETAFGKCNLTELIRTLLVNGASAIVAVPVSETEPDYEAAFARIAELPQVRVVVCDSMDGAVLGKLAQSIAALNDKYRYRIAVAEADGTPEQVIAAADAINSERVLLTAHTQDSVGGQTAAAIAGVIAAQTDPAIPLNGAQLFQVSGTGRIYTDTEITALVQGGVTPVESAGGVMEIVRGVSTRTKTAGVSDSTWREINTVLVADDVMLAVREGVKSLFYRAKNNLQTRQAIRTQVIVELEDKLTQQIIDGYENVTVSVNADDPTACDVAFAFTVTHGLNRINISAFITV